MVGIKWCGSYPLLAYDVETRGFVCVNILSDFYRDCDFDSTTEDEEEFWSESKKIGPGVLVSW